MPILVCMCPAVVLRVCQAVSRVTGVHVFIYYTATEPSKITFTAPSITVKQLSTAEVARLIADALAYSSGHADGGAHSNPCCTYVCSLAAHRWIACHISPHRRQG